jgi:hypothetical protein
MGSQKMQGTATPSIQGIMRKRGHIIKGYKERFFVLVSGTIYYYESERAYMNGLRARGKLFVEGAMVSSGGFSLRHGFQWTGKQQRLNGWKMRDMESRAMLALCMKTKDAVSASCRGRLRPRAAVRLNFRTSTRGLVYSH